MKPTFATSVAFLLFACGFAAHAEPTSVAALNCVTDEKLVNVKTGKAFQAEQTHFVIVGDTVRWVEDETSYSVLIGLDKSKQSNDWAVALDKSIEAASGPGQRTQKRDIRGFTVRGYDLQISKRHQELLITKKADGVSRVSELSTDSTGSGDTEVVESHPTADSVREVTTSLGPDAVHNGYRVMTLKRVCDSKKESFADVKFRGALARLKPRLVAFDQKRADVLAAKKQLVDCMAAPTEDGCLELHKKVSAATLASDALWADLLRERDFDVPRRPRPPVHHGGSGGGSGGGSSHGSSGGSSRGGSGGGSSEAPHEPPPFYRQCSGDSQCGGFANHCFAGHCTQPGFQCDNDSQCPGFANHCFAGKCTVQEPLCNTDSDCGGFANHCFAGRCTNP